MYQYIVRLYSLSLFTFYLIILYMTWAGFAFIASIYFSISQRVEIKMGCVLLNLKANNHVMPNQHSFYFRQCCEKKFQDTIFF